MCPFFILAYLLTVIGVLLGIFGIIILIFGHINQKKRNYISGIIMTVLSVMLLVGLSFQHGRKNNKERMMEMKCMKHKCCMIKNDSVVCDSTMKCDSTMMKNGKCKMSMHQNCCKEGMMKDCPKKAAKCDKK